MYSAINDTYHCLMNEIMIVQQSDGDDHETFQDMDLGDTVSRHHHDSSALYYIELFGQCDDKNSNTNNTTDGNGCRVYHDVQVVAPSWQDKVGYSGVLLVGLGILILIPFASVIRESFDRMNSMDEDDTDITGSSSLAQIPANVAVAVVDDRNVVVDGDRSRRTRRTHGLDNSADTDTESSDDNYDYDNDFTETDTV
jgi:hypothetical protein